MKTILLSIAMLLSFTGNSALAFQTVEQSPNEIQANLTQFSVQHDYLGQIDQGVIRINLTNKTMILTLMSKALCPTHLVCTAVMEEYHVIKLDLVKTYTDGCGATIYQGVKDHTPADGLLESLNVVDNSMMICEIPVLNVTTVEYTSFNPWTQQSTVSYFGGNLLFPSPVLMH